MTALHHSNQPLHALVWISNYGTPSEYTFALPARKREHTSELNESGEYYWTKMKV